MRYRPNANDAFASALLCCALQIFVCVLNARPCASMIDNRAAVTFSQFETCRIKSVGWACAGLVNVWSRNSRKLRHPLRACSTVGDVGVNPACRRNMPGPLCNKGAPKKSNADYRSCKRLRTQIARRMSALGQKRTSGSTSGMSAFPPKADILRGGVDVR